MESKDFSADCFPLTSDRSAWNKNTRATNLPVIATHAVIEEGSETPGLSKYVRLNSIPGCKP
jgi:hypothetical protein